MKTLNLFVAALCIAALTVFGCKQTAEPLMPTGGEWVEITDTTHLPNLQWLSAVYSTWEGFTGLVIRDTAEYQALTTMVDTTDQVYQLLKNKYPILLPPSPDFTQYSLVGFHTLTDPVNYIRKFYINDTLRQYRLHVHLESTSMTKILIHSQNWLRVPRLKSGYTVVFDTTMSQLDYTR